MRKIKNKLVFLLIVSLLLVFCVPVSAIASSETPEAPTITSVRMCPNNINGIVIKWTPVEGVADYYIYRSVDDSSFTRIMQVMYKETYTDTNIENGHKYSYKIKSVKAGAGSPYLSKYSNKKSTYSIGLTNVSASCTSTGIKITWDKVDGVDGYKIYRREVTYRIDVDNNGLTNYIAEAGDYKYLLTKSGENTVSFVNTSAERGKWYEYKVRPYKKVGSTTYINWSDDSNCVKGILPEIVTGVTVSSPADRKVQISWDAVIDTDYRAHYIVSQKNLETGVSKNRYYTGGKNSASFGVSGGGTYSYTVRVKYTNDKNNQFTGPFSEKKTVEVNGCSNHQYEWITTKEPTCTAKGKAAETCKICGYVNSTKSLPKLAHEYEVTEIIEESIGCKIGYQRKTCVNCGLSIVTGYREHPHESGTWQLKRSTDGDGGYYIITQVCDVCGEKMDEKEFDYFISLPTEAEDGLGVLTFPKVREVVIPAGTVIPTDIEIRYYEQ